MDGVFMFKLFKTCIFCVLAAFLVWFGTVLADRQTLNENVIRFHVVADSDGVEDQAVKLQVRDAVVEYLQPVLAELPTAEEARAWLEAHLQEIKAVADRILAENGFAETASVTVRKEAFTTRRYDTFTMPAGVYDALRITLGEGKGQNWWCVVFPQLCLPAVSTDMEAEAAGAGFSDTLTGALTQEYEVRFFLLDCLGWLENFLFGK
jgi:stage II sporulation protein R